MKVENTDKMKKIYIHGKSWEKEVEGPEGLLEVKISELIPFSRYTGAVTIDKEDNIIQTKDEKLWRKRRMRGFKSLLKRVFRSVYFKGPSSTLYPWNVLKESIEKEGYDPAKYGYIIVRARKNSEGERRFQIINGNHRLEVLSALYGPDYKLKVRVTNSASVKGILKIIPDGLRNVPITLFPSFIFFCWYLFLPILITSVLVYLTLSWIKDIRDLSKTETHPKKHLTSIYNKTPKLYRLLMNIHYNLTYIISSIIILLFTIYAFYHYWLEFFIMMGITFILGTIIQYVLYKTKNTIKTVNNLTLNDIIETYKK